MKESEIVQYMTEYSTDWLRKSKYDVAHVYPVHKTEVTKFISEVETQRTLNANDKAELQKALTMMHNIMNKDSNAFNPTRSSSTSSSKDSSSSSTFIFLGGGLNKWVAFIIAAVVCIGSSVAATWGMAKDLFEIKNELQNSQRVAANVATLVLTAAAVVGATFAAMALLATNPIGWAIVGIACLVVGVALLVKATRYIANMIEASYDEKAGVDTDSRFQLTHKEENVLIKKGFKDDIEGIKELIRGLAVKARQVGETGFYGSDKDYKKIIDTLNKVKKGDMSDIPQDVKDMYGIKGKGRGDEAPASELSAATP